MLQMELESSGACVLAQRLKYVLDYVFCTVCMLACTAGTNWNFFQWICSSVHGVYHLYFVAD